MHQFFCILHWDYNECGTEKTELSENWQRKSRRRIVLNLLHLEVNDKYSICHEIKLAKTNIPSSVLSMCVGSSDPVDDNNWDLCCSECCGRSCNTRLSNCNEETKMKRDK